ncbi:unnamed protein product [Closterium sp. NIES-64]|nr:unnamed protein product [Closterium sp. NIES-64]
MAATDTAADELDDDDNVGRRRLGDMATGLDFLKSVGKGGRGGMGGKGGVGGAGVVGEVRWVREGGMGRWGGRMWRGGMGAMGRMASFPASSPSTSSHSSSSFSSLGVLSRLKTRPIPCVHIIFHSLEASVFQLPSSRRVSSPPPLPTSPPPPPPHLPLYPPSPSPPLPHFPPPIPPFPSSPLRPQVSPVCSTAVPTTASAAADPCSQYTPKDAAPARPCMLCCNLCLLSPFRNPLPPPLYVFLSRTNSCKELTACGLPFPPASPLIPSPPPTLRAYSPPLFPSPSPRSPAVQERMEQSYCSARGAYWPARL